MRTRILEEYSGREGVKIVGKEDLARMLNLLKIGEGAEPC